jgi:predicted O-linked N-acetylglucosamine transferase (SPINDLY family)
MHLDPTNAVTCNNVGNALQEVGDFVTAVQMHRRAIDLQPTLAEAHNSLGLALSMQGLTNEALQAYRQAIALDAKFTDAQVRMLDVMRDQGKVAMVESAFAAYRQLLAEAPGNSDLQQNMMFTMNYHPGLSPQDIFEEHVRWGELFAPLASAEPFTNTPDAGRRLRIGYISGDFRNHACAYFLKPILAHHDKQAVEVFCYANVGTPDEDTQLFQQWPDHWLDITKLKDAEVAQRIRRDQIDILIDTAGHTAGNRLPVLAHRPAPVLVTYLGYPNTTGLAVVDYRLTDPVADPSEPADAATPHLETLWRLPDTVACYQPREDFPDVTPLPARHGDSAGVVTLGTLSNPAKINHEVIAVWCEILQREPKARLVVARESIKGSFRDEFLNNFITRGAPREQVVLDNHITPGVRPITRYQNLDLTLDTFPYSGHTTICESLWMGVPMITLRGNALAGRMGASVLSAVGLPELIAETREQYVQKTLALVRDLDRLESLRRSLRAQMASSPLCDAERFTRHLETALRAMWRKWCEQQTGQTAAA